ncbi:uncharacterized protein LY89DRAFT_769671 [Mollisia scopiformis]|uniref:Uncharacterized protein n=1 Tax=Mollisia scopiformis TaxID=149040 RepID=A0A132B1T5_MOLSC|nr:uncharacterized protein LY89DRAFT_769671 [Mollisia scopiformis]KUJ06348.1 hypothetical protein LY89DRAFT_769671 [Mollisia scopiformis]
MSSSTSNLYGSINSSRLQNHPKTRLVKKYVFKAAKFIFYIIKLITKFIVLTIQKLFNLSLYPMLSVIVTIFALTIYSFFLDQVVERLSGWVVGLTFGGLQIVALPKTTILETPTHWYVIPLPEVASLVTPSATLSMITTIVVEVLSETYALTTEDYTYPALAFSQGTSQMLPEVFESLTILASVEPIQIAHSEAISTSEIQLPSTDSPEAQKFSTPSRISIAFLEPEHSPEPQLHTTSSPLPISPTQEEITALLELPTTIAVSMDTLSEDTESYTPSISTRKEEHTSSSSWQSGILIATRVETLHESLFTFATISSRSLVESETQTPQPTNLNHQEL